MAPGGPVAPGAPGSPGAPGVPGIPGGPIDPVTPPGPLWPSPGMIRKKSAVLGESGGVRETRKRRTHLRMLEIDLPQCAKRPVWTDIPVIDTEGVAERMPRTSL